MAAAYWLRTAAGLLLGRAPSCDVVLAGATSSRRQALVHLDEEGPAVAVMGRGEVRVDGVIVAETTPLRVGAALAVGDAEFEVVREEYQPSDASRETAFWVLRGPSGAMFSIAAGRFTVGGAREDDLRLEGVADGAIELFASQTRVEVTAGVALEVDGEPLPEGETALARAGSSISVGEMALTVVAGGALGEGSTLAVDEVGVREIRLEFLPRGGRLHVTRPLGVITVYLSERRCDFVALLLSPPSPLNAGDPIPDEHVWARVWGNQPSGRKALNVLTHRIRRDLDRAGLDGAGLIERVSGGGATRFVLAPGATVTVA